MQTTLLGIAIAFILALLTALVGPYFVNWNDYRAQFEAEAGKLTGLQVRVTGPIDVRMLPTPSVELGGIELGPRGEASRLRARALGIELQLGPLLRGEVRAAEMRLTGPEFSLGINSLGQVDWPAMSLAAADGVAIDRLIVQDGRATLSDARSGSRLVLDKLQFNGDLRSLLGPVRGDGAFVAGGSLYGYKLNLGRYADEGLRVRIAVDTAERPFNVETDGLLSFERGSPRFDGTASVSRPAGAVLASGRAVVAEPMKATSKVSLRADAVLFDQLEFHYGAEERALNLSGTAQLRLGDTPRVQGALSARQLDLDRLIASANTPRRPPLAAAQAFADMFGDTLTPPVPLNLAIGVDALTLGGATLQAVGADLRSEGEGWHLDRLEFRAPGFTQVKLSGKLDSKQGLGFNGVASIDANDPRALVAWLTGTAPDQAQIRPWQLRGEVSLSAAGIAIERLRTELERGVIEGRLAYAWSSGQRPARLDAELKAGELDIDALLNFADTALAGSGLEAPREVELALEIERARLAGFDARRIATRLKLDASGIDIERLSVADFGNATIEANGRIETGAQPGGTMAVSLDARDMAGVLALADRFAPQLADPIRALAGPRSAARLKSTVSLARSSASTTTGKFALNGRVGAIGIDLSGAAIGKPEAFSVTDLSALKAADLRFDGIFDAENGGLILAALGLDRLRARDTRPARLTVAAGGPLGGALRIDARLASGTIDAEAKGVARLAGDRPASLELEQVTGTLAGHKAQGKLSVSFAEPIRVEGAVEVDAIDLPATLAAAIGMRSGGKAWSAEPFARGASDIRGKIEVRAPRGALAAQWPMRQVRGVLRFDGTQMIFEDVEGEVAGGRFSARVATSSGPDGLSARATLVLRGVDAAALIARGSGLPPVTGRVSLEAELEGAGLSPVALVGSLSGKGKLALENARFAGLNPAAFDALVRAVDLGVSTNANRVRDFMATALDSGTVAVDRATADLAIAGGQVRLANVSLRATGADIGLTGIYSLADGALDASLSMTGAAAVGSIRPVVFVSLRGPATAPARTVDATALTGWLALRAVEQQSKRLEEIEKAREEQKKREDARREEEAKQREQARLAEEARQRQAREREELAERAGRAAAPANENAKPSDAAFGEKPDLSPEPASAERAPPLPPAVTVPTPPKPRPDARPAPRAESTSRPARPDVSGQPLNLLGAHN